MEGKESELKTGKKRSEVGEGMGKRRWGKNWMEEER